MLAHSRSLTSLAALSFLLTMGGLRFVDPNTVQEAENASLKTAAALSKLPLYFIENKGQVDRRVSYYVHGKETSAYFTSEGLVLSVSQPDVTGDTWNLGLEFLGANKIQPRGKGLTPAVVSYFTGHPSKWKTGLPSYGGVSYSGLWEGIDLSFAGTSNRLKYSFVVDPSGSPKDIRLSYRGATSLQVKGNGELEVATSAGPLVDEPPTAYQVIEGRRVPVAVTYALRGGAAYGFNLGPYDHTRPLVIDPALLVYAGFIGGSEIDEGRGIAVDQAGNAYVTGNTSSTETSFPVSGGPDLTQNGPMAGFDAFVAKVVPSGTALVYAGYIGGSADDLGRGIAVDQAGNAYVTGSTFSTETSFPVSGGPDVTYNLGDDAFVAKVASSGTALAYAGYLGGSADDSGSGIAVDQAGNAYVTGSTSSTETSFPVSGGPDLTHNGPGGSDAFVAKVASSGTALAYAGYIGGSGSDPGRDIAVDQSGNAYIIGDTTSPESSFPDGDGFGTLGGPDLTHNGNDDAFVAKVAASGTTLAYAGYIGGSDGEDGNGIAVDQAGNAYVTGRTPTTDGSFPDGDGFGTLPGPDLTHNGPIGGSDAFVAKVAASGTALVYAGYIGGSGSDRGNGIAVDQAGNAYVTGNAASTETSFPDGDGFGALGGPDLTQNGSSDAFVAKISETFCLGQAVTLLGTASPETLTGTSGPDVIVALEGDDLIDASGGDDVVCAGDGNDLVIGGAGSDKLDGEGGTDTASFPGSSAITASLTAGTATGAGTDTLAGFENLTGGSKKDTLTGDGNANVLRGEGGRDRLFGRGGKDRLIGGRGRDRLSGGRGPDRLVGGKGADSCDGGKGRDRASGCETRQRIP